MWQLSMQTDDPLMREIGSAIIGNVGEDEDLILRRLVGPIGDRLRVEPSVPAANDRLIGDGERKPEPRPEVRHVIRKIARQPGEKSGLLRVHPDLQIPAQPEVQRQAWQDRPVILRPAGIHVLRHVVVEVRAGNGLASPRDDGGERSQVPGRRVVPDAHSHPSIRHWRFATPR